MRSRRLSSEDVTAIISILGHGNLSEQVAQMYNGSVIVGFRIVIDKVIPIYDLVVVDNELRPKDKTFLDRFDFANYSGIVAPVIIKL